MTAISLAPLSPIALRDFTKSLGWELKPQLDRLYILENARFPRRQLVFPMDPTAPDYPESAWLVIEKLSELVEERPDALVYKAQHLREDVISFRVHADHLNGTLPLNVAGSMVEGMQLLLKASACTVGKPQLHHPRLGTSEAQQILERCHFEPTEVGSFIFKVTCPIQDVSFQGTPTSEDSFVRRVTLALYHGVELLIDAVERDDQCSLVNSMKNSQAPELSSNFCEALVRFHDDALDNAMDLTIHWSALRPQPELKRPLRIQREYFARISEVGRALRPQERHQQEFYVGTVERLDGDMGPDGLRSGEVVLALLTPEGDTVRARVMLDSQEYEVADKAHMKEGAYVGVFGLLQPGRQPRALSELDFFVPLQREAVESLKKSRRKVRKAG